MSKAQTNKKKFIEALKDVPIVSAACAKTGIARSSFYRWKNEDREFALACEEAMEQGTDRYNDVAVSQLSRHIQEGDLRAIFYWLNNRHPQFSAPFRTQVNIVSGDRNMPPEVADRLIRDALKPRRAKKKPKALK